MNQLDFNYRIISCLPTSKPSNAHKSKSGKTSPEIKESDIQLKYYDGGLSKTDAVGEQIGLVRVGLLDHSGEAIGSFVYKKSNLGVLNSLILKKSLDKK